ncbi:MAG: phosphoadenylyl-sulfate reductase [Deltaproteobacteria bacterium]|nr:phosphoadenylyl-sulfate reductase [Deltaproteobacteria bacterium]
MHKSLDYFAQDAETLDAQSLLEWAIQKFKRKIALASSFGLEDVVLIDMAVKVDPTVAIFTIDTGRLHQETYDVIEAIEDKYNVKVSIYFPDTSSVEEMTTIHGPNLFYKGASQRKLCCQVRKVEPLQRALKGLEAWICGLRREQSLTRASVRKVETDEVNGGIYKINPLADWSTEMLWRYVKEHAVPYNKLHDLGYPSIGCAPCTRPIKQGEDMRAGRWWWENPEQKECGLHRR